MTSQNLIYLKDPNPQNMNMKNIQIGFFKWITGIFQFLKDNDVPVLFNVSTCKFRMISLFTSVFILN